MAKSATVVGLAQKGTEKTEVNGANRYLNIADQGFEGNSVVDVVDENNLPLKNYQAVLVSAGEMVFDVACH